MAVRIAAGLSGAAEPRDRIAGPGERATGGIGPVGAETFLHGFTATVALFGQAVGP